MNRILEFDPENEHDVVGRVLLKVHKAIDDNFPNAADASRKFRKTVFSDVEETKIETPALERLNEEALTSASPKELNEKKPVDTAYLPPRRGEAPLTDQAQLEYSKLETIGGRNPFLKKALMVLLVIFGIAFATALWVYISLLP